MTAPALKKLISLDELADLWSVSRKHLYTLRTRRTHPLPCIRIGGRWTVDPDAAAAWLAAEQKG